jgi:hypothetical protein
MTIYQVFESGYDSNDLLATFATRKLANAFVKLYSRGRDEIDESLSKIQVLTTKIEDILPYPIDTKFYRIVIDINGNALAELITLRSYESFKSAFENGLRLITDHPEDKNGNFLRKKGGGYIEIYTGEIEFYVMGTSESVAITDALKRAAKWKKKNKWPIKGEKV